MQSCYNLYSCDPSSYPDILFICDTILSSYIGQTIYINNDNSKKYTVGKTKQIYVTNVEHAKSLNILSLLPIEWTVTSLKYNNIELITTPVVYTLTSSNIQYLSCVDTNCTVISTPITNDNYSNQSDFFNTIFNSFNLPIKSYPGTIASLGGYAGIIINIPFESSFEITLERTDGDLSGLTYVYGIDNTNNAYYELNGGEVSGYVAYNESICLDNTLGITSIVVTTCESTSVVITNTEDTCEDCVPEIEVGEACHIKMRPGEPGFSVKYCDPEEYIKIKCKFSDSVYDLFKRLNYGINTCCESDLDKLDIKNGLLELGEMYDPDLCKPKRKPIVLCCADPCNIETNILIYSNLYCESPIDVTSELIVCMDPSNITELITIN